MFQYAVGMSLAMRLNSELKLDVTHVLRTPSHQGFELNRIFDLKAEIASESDLKDLLGWRRHPSVQKLLMNKYFRLLRDDSVVVEPALKYWKGINDLKGNCYLCGYWQSEKYFCAYQNNIRANFRFKLKMNAMNSSLADHIGESNSVSLHVRRGDYAYDPNARSTHGLCDLSYFAQAINHMTRRLISPTFFVFSDDIIWAKKNLVYGVPMIFVDQNHGVESYSDMRLMSLCRHHIISNSTFGWWGAWLDARSDKIVIAPKQWFANGWKNDDLLPARWLTF